MPSNAGAQNEQFLDPAYAPGRDAQCNKKNKFGHSMASRLEVLRESLMDTLQSMRIFCVVAEAGSFTAAALQLQTNTANVSRNVAQLETYLKVRLLNRTTRSLALTAAGQKFLDRCHRILEAVDEAEHEAMNAHAHAAGQLKLHTMTGIGMHFVIDAVAQYRKTHPEVSFDITLANRVPDLLQEGYDVSIVLASELPDSGLVSQRLGITYSIVCASPEYVQANGMPAKPGDLRSHVCLRLVSPVVQLEKWLFDGPEGQEMVSITNAPFQVNSAEALQSAIMCGMGVGVLPLYAAIDGLRSGRLVRMLPGHRLEQLNLYAVYPSRQYLDAKIKTWVEYLRETMPQILERFETDLHACEAVPA